MKSMAVWAMAAAAALCWCAGCASHRPHGGGARVAAGGKERFLTDQSHLIGKVEYDRETMEMRVQMANSSDWYVYRNVPPEVYESFAGSASKGAFFAKEVKGRFPSRREE